MCPHCKINPVQAVFTTGDTFLCSICTLEAFEPIAKRFRALPPIYHAHTNNRPDLFPELVRE